VALLRLNRLSVWRQVLRAIRFAFSAEAGTWSKLLVLLTAAYVIWPLDLLPGLPPFSWLDDAVVLWLAYHALEYLMRQSRRHRREVIDTTARVSDE